MDDTHLTEKRLLELSRRAGDRYVASEFLTIAEQDALLRMELPEPFILDGGFPGAERRVALFGSEESCGYREDAPIACVYIEPTSLKFAQKLTHRDYLGSLMSLGMRRQMLGDIVPAGGGAYLFCLSSAAGYIVSQLEKVSHTAVKCAIVEKPGELQLEKPEQAELVVASERMDALVAAAFGLSRAESQRLFEQEKVSVGGRIISGASTYAAEGQTVSVRGFGRFTFDGVSRETKKGRLRVLLTIYK